MSEDIIEAMARFAYEDSYPGKPWGLADGFTQAMFRDRASYYAPAAINALRVENAVQVAEAYKRGRAEKDAEVTAYLRSLHWTHTHKAAADMFADAIERGEHKGQGNGCRAE